MIELDKISEKILKQVIKYDNFISPENFKKIKCLKKFSNAEIHECLHNLSKIDLISLNETQDRIRVTFKGKQYFLLKRKQLWQSIIFSFLLPLTVAIITAYFTAKITVNNDVIVHINSINNI